jgi:ubiquinone/menaquinone biosynthesis C-methylase UbiE
VDPRMGKPLSPDIDVEALNDQVAREYPIDDYYVRSPWPIRLIERRRLSVIKEFMGDVEGLELAEIGSGGGHVLRLFPKARLTAIDVSDVYLDIARKNLEGYDIRFLKGEIDKMGLPEGSFDRIVCTEVLEHVVDPDAVLDAIARLLRPSGVAAITVPNDPLIRRFKRIVRRPPARWMFGERIEWGGDKYHFHHWEPEQFQRVLARHLRVAECRGAGLLGFRVRACFKCVPKK